MKQFTLTIAEASLPLLIGAITFVVAITGFVVVGRIYTDTQARGLIEAMAPAILTLCFAVITSTSTILTLMLAVLGFVHRLESEFEASFYRHIKLTALLTIIALASSTLMLLFLSIPLTEQESLSDWFTLAYTVLIAGAAWITSLLIAIVISIYSTLIGILDRAVPSLNAADSERAS